MLTSVPTLDRVSLKGKVVDAPEILTVIESIPHLSTYLNALYKCQYADFFKVSKSMTPCLTEHVIEGLLTSHSVLVWHLMSLQVLADFSLQAWQVCSAVQHGTPLHAAS